MARIRADGRISRLQGSKHKRGVLHRPDETSASAHHELAVPVVRQQQLEVGLGTNYATDLAVRHGRGFVRDRSDPDIRQLTQRIEATDWPCISRCNICTWSALTCIAASRQQYRKCRQVS